MVEGSSWNIVAILGDGGNCVHPVQCSVCSSPPPPPASQRMQPEVRFLNLEELSLVTKLKMTEWKSRVALLSSSQNSIAEPNEECFSRRRGGCVADGRLCRSRVVAKMLVFVISLNFR